MFIDIQIRILLLIDIQYIDIHVQFLLHLIFEVNILLERFPKMDIYII